MANLPPLVIDFWPGRDTANTQVFSGDDGIQRLKGPSRIQTFHLYKYITSAQFRFPNSLRSTRTFYSSQGNLQHGESAHRSPKSSLETIQPPGIIQSIDKGDSS